MEIRPLRAAEVAGVSARVRHPVVVSDRLARQRSGRCWYAIAWEGEHPVGQALLHWRRPVPLAFSAMLDTAWERRSSRRRRGRPPSTAIAG